MKRFKRRGTGLAMALGMFATVANAGETVSSAAGGWFAVDSRDVKDTTLEGGVIVGGKTGIALTSSANAWGEDGAGTSATITWSSTSGGSGTVASATTAEAVAWTPEANLGTITLTYVSGDVEKTAQFGIEALGAGGDTYAQIKDGVCTIGGTGSTTDENPLADCCDAITKVVVTDGVTGISSHFFENYRNITDVSLASSVTSVGEQAFHKCYSLTNVTSAATTPVIIANGAFMRCNSLESLAFEVNPVWNEQSFKIQAAIRMNDDTPEVYSIPSITIAGKAPRVMGKVKLSDTSWTDITNLDPAAKKAYHFFMIETED